MNGTLERKRIIEKTLKSRQLWLTVVESTSGFVVILSALVGNIILCLAIYKFPALRKLQNYYIVALAVSDFLLTLFCSSLGLVVVFLGRWPFGDKICQTQGALTFFASFSLLNVTLIALNRYVKMVWSVNIYQRMYTKNSVLLSIAVCAVFSGVFVIPFALQGFCFHAGQLACFSCKSKNEYKQARVLGSYSVLIAVSYPVMSFCYYKVFRKVHSHFTQIADSTLREDAQKSFAEEVKVTKILSLY